MVVQIWNVITYKSLENIELTVFSDSQYTLKALKRLEQDSRQFLVGNIACLSHDINSSTKYVKVGFHWFPAYNGIPGNKKAYQLAQKATKKGKNVYPSLRPFPMARAIWTQTAKDIKVIEDSTGISRSKTGQFVKSIDKKIPDSHISLLYNGKFKSHIGLLCQLRTGIYWLNSYLSRIQATKLAECGCNTGRERFITFYFVVSCGTKPDSP